jgi:CheY-like chemotaxis protein
VIEDEAEIRSTGKHPLVKANDEVVEAEDGEKAIQL